MRFSHTQKIFDHPQIILTSTNIVRAKFEVIPTRGKNPTKLENFSHLLRKSMSTAGTWAFAARTLIGGVSVASFLLPPGHPGAPAPSPARLAHSTGCRSCLLVSGDASIDRGPRAGLCAWTERAASSAAVLPRCEASLAEGNSPGPFRYRGMLARWVSAREWACGARL